jgi:hypothetical protein
MSARTRTHTHTHSFWMSALTLWGPSLLWTGWGARCLYRAVSGSVRPDGRDATRALCSQLASGLAGSRSLTFRWVELLDHTDCGASERASPKLRRPAERDPTQPGAATLHADRPDGRTLGDRHLGQNYFVGGFHNCNEPIDFHIYSLKVLVSFLSYSDMTHLGWNYYLAILWVKKYNLCCR